MFRLVEGYMTIQYNIAALRGCYCLGQDPVHTGISDDCLVIPNEGPPHHLLRIPTHPSGSEVVSTKRGQP